MVISYYHDIIRPHGISRFWCQVKVKNTNQDIYPLAKGRTEKINALRAMTFDDGRASDAQTIVAPPKHLFIDFTPHFFEKTSAKNFCSVSKN